MKPLCWKLLGCVLLVSACGQRKVVTSQDFVKTVETTEASTKVVTTPAAPPSWSWTYQGERGPNNWASLNPDYSVCGDGSLQSPVNLKWKAPSKPSPLSVSYRPADVVVMNTGYALRMEFTPQSQLTFQNTDYLLEKAEIRTPSEHRLSSKKLPVEIQFYHRSSNGLRQAMISLFAVQGKASPWFQDILDMFDQTPVYKSSPPFRMNIADLIPKRLTFYHYQGSLTHPPCIENVDWFVLNTPIQLSASQIAKLKSMYDNNNRPTQKLNGRPVKNY